MISSRLTTKRIWFAVCIIGFLCCIPVANAYTVERLNVTDHNDFALEPGKAEIFLNPGETITKSISITNRVNHPVTFKISTEDFVGSNDQNNPVKLLGNDKSPYSFKDNLIPEVSEITLNFGERASIPVTIVVPPNAQPGGYYASVLVSNEPTEMMNASSTSAAPMTRIISRAGALFFIRVNGEAKESGQLDDFRVSPQRLLYQQGPFTFQVLFKNDGNVHLVPYGTIEIKNTLGKPIASLPIDAYFSLPRSTRYREIIWDKPLLIGRYTATVTLHRGYKNSADVTDVKTVVFWVVPWKILGALFAIAFVFIFLFYYIRKNFEFRRKT